MATTSTTPFSVAGKSAIVTGAGSGINLTFASLLLSRQCNVLFADLSLRPEAQKVVDAHSQPEQGKGRAVFLKTDVTNWEHLARMFEVASKEFDSVDIVCPGAGVFEPEWSDFWHPPGSSVSKDSPTGGRYASLDINLVHPIRTTQLAIAEYLSPSKGSKASPTNPKRIVLISSIAGQTTPPTSLYVVSKHGMNGFTRSLQGLDSIGIRVNAVAPGVVRTPLWMDNPGKRAMVDEEKDVWVTPQEVAKAMLDCLEDDDLVGGTVLEVGHGHRRKVEAFNDPGPSGKGTSASNQMPMAFLKTLEEKDWGKVNVTSD